MKRKDENLFKKQKIRWPVVHSALDEDKKGTSKI